MRQIRNTLDGSVVCCRCLRTAIIASDDIRCRHGKVAQMRDDAHAVRD